MPLKFILFARWSFRNLWQPLPTTAPCLGVTVGNGHHGYWRSFSLTVKSLQMLVHTTTPPRVLHFSAWNSARRDGLVSLSRSRYAAHTVELGSLATAVLLLFFDLFGLFYDCAFKLHPYLAALLDYSTYRLQAIHPKLRKHSSYIPHPQLVNTWSVCVAILHAYWGEPEWVPHKQ